MRLHRGPQLTRRHMIAAPVGAGSLLLGGLSTACGSQSGTSESAGKTSTPVELRLHGSTSGAEGEYWPKVVAGFNERQNKARAVFEPWPPNQSGVPAVLALGAAGTLGDVMRLVAFSTYSQVAAKGFLRDLSPLVQRDRYDLKPFYAAAVDTLKFRSKQFGLPHIGHPGFCGIFVNLEALKQAGLKEPNDTTWTFEEFQNIAKQLSPAGRGGAEQWGIFPPTTIQHVTVAARAYGGNTLDQQGKRSQIAEPASVQGVQYIADLIQRDRAAPPPGTLQGNDRDNLIQGKVAMAWTNFGIINPLRNQAQGLQWKAFLSPKGPKSRGAFMGVDSASQYVDSKHADQAFDLVKHIVSKEVSLGWFEYGFAPGARQDTWNDPKVTSDAAFKVFTRAMGEASPLHLPDNGLIVEYNAALNKELGNIWSGKASVKDAAEAARRAGQEVLERGG